MCSKSNETLSIISSFYYPICYNIHHQKQRRTALRCGVLKTSKEDKHRSKMAHYSGKKALLCFHVDAILASILWTVLNESEVFRLNFTLWIFNKWKAKNNSIGDGNNSLDQEKNIDKYFKLLNTKVTVNHLQCMKINVDLRLSYGSISIVSDIRWCKRLQPLVVEVMVLSDLMSWLSTLGGAYSSLGEQSMIFSEKAGHTSRHQLLIASRLNNPVLMAQCKVFLAMSMVQRGHLKTAAKIIRQQYAKARNGLNDYKLEASCKAVWNKIQYIKQLKVH